MFTLTQDRNPILRCFLLFALFAAFAQAKAGAVQNQDVDCLRLSEVKGTDVIDNQTIMFNMRGGGAIEMKLQFECPTLKFDNAFYYSVIGGRLCKTDMITTRSGFSCPIEAFENLDQGSGDQP